MEIQNFDFEDVSTLLSMIEETIAKGVMEFANREQEGKAFTPAVSETDKLIPGIATGVAKSASAISGISKKLAVSAAEPGDMTQELSALVQAVFVTAMLVSKIDTVPENSKLEIPMIKKGMANICIDLGIDPSVLDSDYSSFP